MATGILTASKPSSFNPCFGGFFSKTLIGYATGVEYPSFNPCFGGFFSKTEISGGVMEITEMFQSLFWWIFL